MSVNFVHLIKMYHIFRILIWNDDAVIIKLLYKELLPIYLHTMKNLYYNIIPLMVDELYNTIGARNLHLAIVNQTSPLYDGVDINGAPVDNWSMGSLFELIQKFYHQMGFQSKLKVWFKHSVRVVFNNKSNLLFQEKYTKGLM